MPIHCLMHNVRLLCFQNRVSTLKKTYRQWKYCFFGKRFSRKWGWSLDELLFIFSTVFSLVKSRKPCTLSWYAKYCKPGRSNFIRWRFALHLFRSTFWNTGSGYIPHFFASSRKTKILIPFGNQDFTVFCFSLKWCHQELNYWFK